MKAKSLHETWHQLRAQASYLLCSGTPMGTGLAGRACQQTVWEVSLVPREFTTPALEMTDKTA